MHKAIIHCKTDDHEYTRFIFMMKNKPQVSLQPHDSYRLNLFENKDTNLNDKKKWIKMIHNWIFEYL